MFGLMLCAPRMVELMPEITSGIGNETDIADHPGLRHLRRDLALDVAAFVEAGRVGAHIRCALEAGAVFEERCWDIWPPP